MKRTATIHWQELFKKFLPVFVFAAVVPVVLASTFTYSSADRNNTLRIWFEPSTASLKKNESVELTIFAQYSDSKRFLNGVSIAPTRDTSLTLTPQRLEYTKPFQGTVIIGTLLATADASGTYHVTVTQENIQTSTDVQLEIGQATIVVK